MRQFSEEVVGLTAWLQDVESFLQAEQQLPVGDLDTLEAQLEQSNVCILLDCSQGLRSVLWRGEGRGKTVSPI